MAAFLRRRKLIFKVNAGCARLDHRLHQLKRVQVSAESSFRIRDEWSVDWRRFRLPRLCDVVRPVRVVGDQVSQPLILARGIVVGRMERGLLLVVVS